MKYLETLFGFLLSSLLYLMQTALFRAFKEDIPVRRILPAVMLALFASAPLQAAASHAHLEVIERYDKPDTRGAIWYDGTDIFLAGHKSGLWTIGKCGEEPHYPSDDDEGLWDIWIEGNYIYGVGERGGLYIYDKLHDNQVVGELKVKGIGVYVIGNYAYVIDEKSNIYHIDIRDKSNPIILHTYNASYDLSQIRGNGTSGDGRSRGPGNHLYISTANGELVRYNVDTGSGILSYKDTIDLGYDDHEGRKLFVKNSGAGDSTDDVYVDSNYGELAIIEATSATMTRVGNWSSITALGRNHGGGSRWPASGGVFVTDFQQETAHEKKFALITAANGNSAGALYWLDITDPGNITLVDDFCDRGDSCEGNGNYGFNNIWINGYEVYMGAHDGYVLLGLFGLDIDLRKREEDGTYSGEGIGVINEGFISVKEGESKEYIIRVSNYNDTYWLKAKLTASPPASDKWRYTFWRVNGDDPTSDQNLTDITDEIVTDDSGHGGYVSEFLKPETSADDPGGYFFIKVKVEALDGISNDTELIIQGSYESNGTECGRSRGQKDIFQAKFGPFGDVTKRADTAIGPFDAWDLYRDGIDAEGNIMDINVSTKISDREFALLLGCRGRQSVQDPGKKAEKKGKKGPGKGKKGPGEKDMCHGADNETYTIYYALYSDTGRIDGTRASFPANKDAHYPVEATFGVDDAYRSAHVGFEFCAEGKIKDGKLTYILKKDTECNKEHSKDPNILNRCRPTTEIYDKGKLIETRDKGWFLCYNTDAFSIRPRNFDITLPSSPDRELYRASEEYYMGIRALDWDGDPTGNYKQTADNIDIDHHFFFADDEMDSITAPRHSGNVNIDQNVSKWDFEEGISTSRSDPNRHNTVGFSFSDVGKIRINPIDKDWAAIDYDDTPADCNESGHYYGEEEIEGYYGRYICGTGSEGNLTFIPHHFGVVAELENHRHGTFTYLTFDSDLRMSAHLDVTINALNKEERVTKNFNKDPKYYENGLKVILTVPLKSTDGTDIQTDLGLAPVKHDISSEFTLLGFGGEDSNGTHHIAWNDSNDTQRLMFNYNKSLSVPINPFDINGTEVQIDVLSHYNGSTVSVDVNGSDVASQHATFYYAGAKPSKYLYNDVTNSSVNTPISLLVYCDLDMLTCSTFGIDIISGKSSDYQWYLSVGHQVSANDGNISLIVGDISPSGGSATVDRTVSSLYSGIDTSIHVTKTSGTTPLPLTVNINLDTSSSISTNKWLLYNASDPSNPPIPFYKVRFIGQSNWAGVGKTGFVLESNASKKKNHRLSW